MTVTQLYGQIVQTTQDGANSFPRNSATDFGVASVTITAEQVYNLVATNQKLASLFEQCGQAFAAAAVKLASLWGENDFGTLIDALIFNWIYLKDRIKKYIDLMYK